MDYGAGGEGKEGKGKGGEEEREREAASPEDGPTPQKQTAGEKAGDPQVTSLLKGQGTQVMIGQVNRLQHCIP